jgi:hypothetical protein
MIVLVMIMISVMLSFIFVFLPFPEQVVAQVIVSSIQIPWIICSMIHVYVKLKKRK